MYQILPETENRTLEEIELHFSDNKRKINDRHIKKISPSTVDSAFNDGKPTPNTFGQVNDAEKYWKRS